MKPRGDNDNSRWPTYGRTLTWMLRQTEVTAPVDLDNCLLALLAGESQKAHTPRGQDIHLSELTYQDRRLLVLLSWLR